MAIIVVVQQSLRDRIKYSISEVREICWKEVRFSAVEDDHEEDSGNRTPSAVERS